MSFNDYVVSNGHLGFGNADPAYQTIWHTTS